MSEFCIKETRKGAREVYPQDPYLELCRLQARNKEVERESEIKDEIIKELKRIAIIWPEILRDNNINLKKELFYYYESFIRTRARLIDSPTTENKQFMAFLMQEYDEAIRNKDIDKFIVVCRSLYSESDNCHLLLGIPYKIHVVDFLVYDGGQDATAYSIGFKKFLAELTQVLYEKFDYNHDKDFNPPNYLSIVSDRTYKMGLYSYLTPSYRAFFLYHSNCEPLLLHYHPLDPLDRAP